MGVEPMSRPFTGHVLSSRRNSLLHQSSAKLVVCSLPVKVIDATYSILAGGGGLEPPYGGTKNRCFTNLANPQNSVYNHNLRGLEPPHLVLKLPHRYGTCTSCYLTALRPRYMSPLHL